MTNATLIISIVAIAVSLYTLWANLLIPFRLKVLHGPLTLTFYHVDDGVDSWWVPSIDIGFSFHNKGAISGQILDVRIILEIDGQEYVFYPMWIVDYPKYQEQRGNRAEWISKATIRRWYPLLLRGKTSVDMHLVLESEAWCQAILGNGIFKLQVAQSNRRLRSKWRDCGEYSMELIQRMYDERSYWAANNVQLTQL